MMMKDWSNPPVRFRDLNISKTNFLSSSLKFFTVGENNISVYDYFSISEINDIVNLLKERYYDRYIIYTGNEFKRINNKSFVEFVYQVENMRQLANIDWKQESATTGIAFSEILGEENVDMKRADTPTTLTGDLVDTYTTSQDKNKLEKEQNELRESETITEGNLISQLLRLDEYRERMLKIMNRYFESFSVLFLNIDIED